MNKIINNFPDVEQMRNEAVKLICSSAHEAVKEEGRFSLALSGGNTPEPIYRKLLETDFPWEKTDFFWGDERCVPPDDLRSNYFNAVCAFLSLAPVPVENIHRIKADLPPEKAAAEYEKELINYRDNNKRDKIFDLVLLGMGNDGHTASLFPESKALYEEECLVKAVPAPLHMEPKVPRITLTYPGIAESKFVFFIIEGNNKRSLLTSSEDYPALNVCSEKIVWFTA